MILKKFPATLFIMLLLMLLTPIFTFGAPTNSSYSALPLNWVQMGLASDGDTFIGLGTRDPNLGENLGLEMAISMDNKCSPNLDLLYFHDISENFSTNIGIGVYAKNEGSGSTFHLSYSAGVWFHLLENYNLSVGFHSLQGITLRYGLWF